MQHYEIREKQIYALERFDTRAEKESEKWYESTKIWENLFEFWPEKFDFPCC